MILIDEGSATLDPMGNVKSGVEKWKHGKRTKVVQKKAVYKYGLQHGWMQLPKRTVLRG